MSQAHRSPLQGRSLNYKNTKKGEVGFLREPQQLMSTPGAAWGQAWVIIMPVVIVIIRADQIAVCRLLVVGDQMFVREPLDGQTDTVGMLLMGAWRLPGRGWRQKLPAMEVCGANGEVASTGWGQCGSLSLWGHQTWDPLVCPQLHL